MRARWLLLPVFFAASTMRAAPVDPAADPSAWLHALDAATPEAEGRSVQELRLELGPARLHIKSGTLVAVRGPHSRPQEILFFGEARFELATDDPVESYQIELFTGRDRLEEPVSKAVLAIADDAVVDNLLSRPAERLAPERAKDAAALLAAWRDSREYLRGDVRLSAHADALGDRPAQRFVAAWLETPRLGRFLLHVDPYAAERTRVEQFVPFRIGDLDRDGYRKWLRREQEEGRQLDRDPDDIGDWNVWFVERSGGRASFEPSHYEISLGIGDPLSPVQGRTVVDLVAKADGARVIGFSLHPDLRVNAVLGPGGTPLSWTQMRDQISVVLPEPAAAGANLRVEIRYGGILFEKTDDGLIVKRTTTSWYPRTGSVDRATYRAEFTWPSTLSVLGSGRKESAVVDGLVARQVRVLDKPSAFFGFEMGKFKIEERTLGHVALEIGFLSDVRTASPQARERTIATIADALESHEASFGPYPLDVLTVATTRYSFAQGFLGFVTLADPIVQGIDDSDARALDRRRIVAHELAHQWWGNLVGWASDRDVWLSESLANYAAAVYRRRTAEKAGEKVESAYLDLAAQRAVLATPSSVGRPVEGLGPIVLGPRLFSSFSHRAYRAVVYEKGSMVLALLAEQLGEEPLLAMLKEIAQRANHRPLDTETVFQALAKMSGQDLAPFTRQFIYGVGFPALVYRYKIDPMEGGFAAKGTARLQSYGFRRDRLAREDGRLLLRPAFHAYQDSEGSKITVPALLAVSDTKKADEVPTRGWHALGELESRQLRGFKTQLKLAGPETPIAYRAAQQPSSLVLDPRRLLPAPVIDATAEPKRALVAQAAALRSTGREAEALSTYTEALALRLDRVPEGVTATRKNDVPWWNDRLDGRIHLALAELALDRIDANAARRELSDRTVNVVVDAEAVTEDERWYFGNAADAIRRPDVQRDVLRARLALLEGDGATAYKLLKGALALDVVQSEDDTVFDAMRKKKLAEGAIGTAGDYLLYAAAAHDAGHEDVCLEATAEARRRGGDVTLLDELHAASVPR